MTPPTVWQRPLHESQGGTASVTLFVFAEQLLELTLPVSRSRYGLPAEFDFNQLEVRQHLRSEAPEWFDGFFAPVMLRLAELDLPSRTARLEQMVAAYSVRIALEEPPNLGYLQGCWGAAKWICECGAEFVNDAAAIRWHSAESVLSLDPLREFDATREVSVVFETDATPGFGHLTHTRGLAKFGRPDVVLIGAEPEDADAAAALLNDLARRAALGATLRSGQTAGPSHLPPRPLLPYEPGMAHPQVHLNNDGLVLDIKGWGLRDLA